MHGIIQSKRAVYWVAGLISLFISLWIFKQTELINPDGICYVESAANMPKGLHYAMHLCGQAGWPFYSILIYGMHLLTHFTMENSAYLLDALLSLLSVLTFIRIVEVLALQKQNHFILWLAAFVILFSNIFNDVRHYIIRDHGYFAFYLLAILFLLNFFQIRKWFYALGWSVASIIATFFRIEGAIFLALIPLITFLDWRTSFVIRIQSFFKLNLLSIIGVCFVAVLLWFHPEESLGRFREINLQQASMFLTVLQTKSELLKTYILNKHAMIDPKIILFFTLLVWYLYSAISNVSWIYMILVVYAWSKKLLKMPPIMNMVIWSYLIINVALTFLFLSTNMFISKRYLVGQSLVLMLWVPFALQALFLQWRTRKLCVMLVLILLVISAASGLIEFGYSKRYIRDAGEWLQQHVSSDTKVYSNDYLVKYYSKHFDQELFLETMPNTQVNFTKYDYVAIRQNKKNKPLQPLNPAQFKSVQVFQNSRGDQVVIYRRSSSTI